MKTMFIQDHKSVVVGAKLQHDAEGEDTFWDCDLIDIDNNLLWGLVKYTSGPHAGEEQWVPGNLLREPPPPVVEPQPEAPVETPVRDVMKEAGAEEIKSQVEATKDEAEPTQEETKGEQSERPVVNEPAVNPS